MFPNSFIALIPNADKCRQIRHNKKRKLQIIVYEH